MPALKWTTGEQEVWLSAYYKEHYAPCIPTRNYTEFKPVFYEAWFKMWPESVSFCQKHGLDPSATLSAEQQSSLGDAIRARQDQLIAWMRWQANKARRVRHREGLKVDPLHSLQALISKPCKRRKLSEEEVFSKLFYDDTIKVVFEAECTAQGVRPTDKKSRMEIRRKVTRDCWKEASQDDKVRERVLEEKARRDAEVNGLGQDVERNEPADGNLVHKDNIVSVLPATFQELLLSLHEQTGWSFSLLAAGPDVSSKNIRTFSVHAGETSLGMNFFQSYPAFQERVMQPFERFARYVHDGSNVASGTCDKVPVTSASDASGLIAENMEGSQQLDISSMPTSLPDGGHTMTSSRPVTPSSDTPSYDPFDDETLERLSTHGSGFSEDDSESLVPDLFPPSSPPTSQYYYSSTRRNESEVHQGSAPSQQGADIQDPVLRRIVQSMSAPPTHNELWPTSVTLPEPPINFTSDRQQHDTPGPLSFPQLPQLPPHPSICSDQVGADAARRVGHSDAPMFQVLTQDPPPPCVVHVGSVPPSVSDPSASTVTFKLHVPMMGGPGTSSLPTTGAPLPPSLSSDNHDSTSTNGLPVTVEAARVGTSLPSIDGSSATSPLIGGILPTPGMLQPLANDVADHQAPPGQTDSEILHPDSNNIASSLVQLTGPGNSVPVPLTHDFATGPRRSGRACIPSTRSAVANDIGTEKKRQRRY